MRKEIYREIPEQLHQQFLDTISQLPGGEKKRRISTFSTKKVIALVAAVVAALSTLTVGATALYRMHRIAAERLGVDSSLAEQFVTDGVIREETGVAATDGLRVQALQAVCRENSVYLLLEVEAKKGIELNEDVSFESSEVTGEMSFTGCTADIISSSIEGNHAFWEINLLFPMGGAYTGGEATIKLTNLIQTEKALEKNTLVEGTWELDVQLPTQADTCVYLCEKPVLLGKHMVELKRVEANPFSMQLYLEQEDARHCLQYQQLQLSAVKYEDGRLVQEAAVVDQKMLKKNKQTGELYVQLYLENAIEADKLDTLIWDEGQEISLLDWCMDENYEQTASQTEDIMDDWTLLYEKEEHGIWTDGMKIYLEDMRCGMREVIMDLAKVNYDTSKGGDIAIGPGGKTVVVLPDEDSNKVYVGNVAYGLNADENMHEAERNSGWPEENFRVQ